MNLRKHITCLTVPLTILLMITFIEYTLADKNIIYKSKNRGITIDIEEYTNVLEMSEPIEEIIGIYNTQAGSVDTWSDGISYDAYRKYLDDLLYVNGEIASSEDFGDYLVYEFDNYKTIKVLKDSITNSIEYKHEIDENSVILDEQVNTQDNTIKRVYDNNIETISQIVYDVVSSTDSIRILKINIFNIFKYYIICVIFIFLCAIYKYWKGERNA